MTAYEMQFTDLYTSDHYRPLLPEQPFAEGFIFAVATSPEIPMPETWMPWLVYGKGGAHHSASMDRLAEGLMNALRDTLGNMRVERCCIPQIYLQMHGDDEVSPELAKWLTGLLAAHNQLEPCWQQAWVLAAEAEKNAPIDAKEAPEKRLRRCLTLFSTLADVKQAMAARNKDRAAQLQRHLPVLVKQVPGMLKEYIGLAGELAAVLPNQFETFVKKK
ncbi:UPF0149 family protein [Aestuariibacter sp. A3R04]|uniref:UPF0149 family protein n=1 Tax=Aestuariibacter sp. A3R04 TaxID=2841571 RepID=UPI001C0A1D7B|nr:UPF0149 family protein [Aestuariibacter sp. A3R04]MBU3021426.1 YecA family protein [Aestuariibacter sp. A3R04]